MNPDEQLKVDHVDLICSDPSEDRNVSPSKEIQEIQEVSKPSGAQFIVDKLTVGHLIDSRYQVLAHIGSGGMGEVYKVLDLNTRAVYALKMISPHLAERQVLTKRLEHEAQAARTLVHGNIVSVYDVGKGVDGAPYLIMDFVDGHSLEEILKKEVMLPAARAIPIFIQIAEALVHARQKGIVHRDLKPSNILLTKTSSGLDIVKIVDFGIAKISDQGRADKTKLTQTGELLGTPLYMSPEQCVGDELDERSDIYSFGCIMYELLTGRSPFAAENSIKVILKHLSDTPPPGPTGPSVSNELKQVIMRCLRRSRFERYQNAVELHIDLERVLEGKKLRTFKHDRRKTRKVLIYMGFASIAILAFCLIGISLSQPEVLSGHVYQDDFSNLRDWRGTNANKWASNHVLTVRALPRTGTWMASNQSLVFTDFDASIMARVTEGPENMGSAGLIFWCKDLTHSYALVYNTHGQVYIARWLPGQRVLMLPYGNPIPCAAVKTGLNEWNNLRIVVKDGKGTGYVNGQKAIEFSGQPPEGGGFVGVTVMRSDKKGGEATALGEFRDLLVRY